MQKEIIKDMNCDMETGVCEIVETTSDKTVSEKKKPVRLLYFTDPICSSCWGIEPQLRKLKQEYGQYFDIEYRMGGLLKSWGEYGGNDVNGPETVALHWKEASAHYEMPIDGEVWNKDPLHSSYPPSIGVKAAQLQDTKKGELFLRRIKEMVFMENKNITRMENLLQAADETGLDVARFEKDYSNSAAQLFEEDLAMARAWGVRGFPTIYFIDEDDNRFKVYGSKPYQVYVQALLKLLPGNIHKNKPVSFESSLNLLNTITIKEFSVFHELDLQEAEAILNTLESQNKVQRIVSDAGPLWKKQ